MRKLLVIALLLLCVATSADVMAGAYRGSAHAKSGQALKASITATKVQFAKKRGSRRIRPIIRRARPRTNSRAYIAPGRAIRSSSGVLRRRSGQVVRSPAARSGRDIGAGVAVQRARGRVAGEVLGVRLNGSVYNVKVLDRGRVRIVTIDAYSGTVLSVR